MVDVVLVVDVAAHCRRCKNFAVFFLRRGCNHITDTLHLLEDDIEDFLHLSEDNESCICQRMPLEFESVLHMSEDDLVLHMSEDEMLMQCLSSYMTQSLSS